MPAEAAETEHDRVTRWRERELVKAGYPDAEAYVIAARHDIDLHEAVELLIHGCPFEVAYKILI